jgi:myo-inositol 2-dehydrogenase/D-chiro-inositol 1-dehydrogenase
MVNVGVIGAGLMGSTHARLLKTAVSGADVVALSDPVSAEAVARELGIGVRHADALDLIADPAVDAVVIASPAATHEPFALACIEAGKPVLCEKPLAPDAAAARRIAEADAGRRLVTVGFMRRYDPGYADMKGRLDAGTIGAPLLVHCAHRNPSVHPFFDSAMIITDTAVHEVDITRWLLDDEIVRATALAPVATRRARDGLRDPQLLLFETARGRLVDVEAFVSAGYAYDLRCEVVGEDGTLELLPPATVSLRTDHAEALAIPPGFQHRFATAYVNELQAWVAAIALATEPGGPTAWDGFAAAAVCEAAVGSLRSGRPVEIPLPH